MEWSKCGVNRAQFFRQKREVCGGAREVPSRLAQQPVGLGLDGFSCATMLAILLAEKWPVWSSAVLYSLRVEYGRCLSSGFGAGFCSETRQVVMGWYAGGGCALSASLCVADRGIQSVNALSVYYADDSPAARRREDHVPVLERVSLYRGDHIHRYGYITPQFLLIPNVRRKHCDMRDDRAEA